MKIKDNVEVSSINRNLSSTKLQIASLTKEELDNILDIAFIIKPKETILLIKDNIDEICNLSDYGMLKKIIFETIKSSEINNLIDREFFNKIAKLLLSDDFFEIFYLNQDLKPKLKEYLIDMLENDNLLISSDQILSILFSYQDTDEIIKKYFNLFLKNSNNLINLKEEIEIYDDLLELTNNYMNDNRDQTIRDLIKKGLNYFNINDMSDDLAIQKLMISFLEISKIENIKVSEIKIIAFGTSSFVYKIGSKVLKFSIDKQKFNSIDHRRILKPLLKKDIKLNASNDSRLVTIEVTNFVNTNGISEEDAYMVFKELNEQAILWTDPNPENIGRLFNSLIDKNNSNLEKDELVIIDSEYIYLKDFKDIKYGNKYYFNKFENRYQSELQNNYSK